MGEYVGNREQCYCFFVMYDRKFLGIMFFSCPARGRVGVNVVVLCLEL